jgi:hypothetical protein
MLLIMVLLLLWCLSICNKIGIEVEFKNVRVRLDRYFIAQVDHTHDHIGMNWT